MNNNRLPSTKISFKDAALYRAWARADIAASYAMGGVSAASSGAVVDRWEANGGAFLDTAYQSPSFSLAVAAGAIGSIIMARQALRHSRMAGAAEAIAFLDH